MRLFCFCPVTPSSFLAQMFTVRLLRDHMGPLLTISEEEHTLPSGNYLTTWEEMFPAIVPISLVKIRSGFGAKGVLLC